jgi:hypothetical protein
MLWLMCLGVRLVRGRFVIVNLDCQIYWIKKHLRDQKHVSGCVYEGISRED